MYKRYPQQHGMLRNIVVELDEFTMHLQVWLNDSFEDSVCIRSIHVTRKHFDAIVAMMLNAWDRVTCTGSNYLLELKSATQYDTFMDSVAAVTSINMCSSHREQAPGL